jgi:predicted RNA-binding protein (TIGR00451 family)
MKRKQMRKDEIKRIISETEPFFDEPPLKKKDQVELIDDKVIVVNGDPAFFYESERPIPLLKRILTDGKTSLKKVTVDMGAIKFVTSGADVMRPGITAFEPGIDKGEPVIIVDETHGKPLAIGKAMYPRFRDGDQWRREK